jgi:geranylgeranyl diphosphate synthase, type I
MSVRWRRKAQGCDTGRVIEGAVSDGFILLKRRFDDALGVFLSSCRREIESSDPDAAVLVGEIQRLIAAGGKRLRPAFCYWGYRAAGGSDGAPIVQAGAALELLHTMALIHDDLMDGSKQRRGVASTKYFLEAEAADDGLVVDADAYGTSAAILIGDGAAVLADRMFLEAGFDPSRTVAALKRYHAMRGDMAIGQYMDIAGLAREPDSARRAASLKGGSYTVEGPLLVGAALAGGDARTDAMLSGYGEPLGEAFQLLDDIRDREGSHGATPASVGLLIDRATDALDPSHLDPEAVGALSGLAGLVRMSWP